MGVRMEYFKNCYYIISHVFLMIFIPLFLPHRFSNRKTAVLCFCSFLILVVSDPIKLNIFPDNDLCYVVVTVFQIVVTQFTVILIAKKRDS